jgi:hypothetical protein
MTTAERTASCALVSDHGEDHGGRNEEDRLLGDAHEQRAEKEGETPTGI